LNTHHCVIQSILGHQTDISGDSDQQMTMGGEILLQTDFGRRCVLFRQMPKVHFISKVTPHEVHCGVMSIARPKSEDEKR
jgi:hypothetical protein